MRGEHRIEIKFIYRKIKLVILHTWILGTRRQTLYTYYKEQDSKEKI